MTIGTVLQLVGKASPWERISRIVDMERQVSISSRSPKHGLLWTLPKGHAPLPGQDDCSWRPASSTWSPGRQPRLPRPTASLSRWAREKHGSSGPAPTSRSG